MTPCEIFVCVTVYHPPRAPRLAHRPEEVAVHALSVMVALHPTMAFWDMDVTILVAQRPVITKQHQANINTTAGY